MLEGVSNPDGPVSRQIAPWVGEGSRHRRYGQIHLLQRQCLAIDRLSGSPLRGELRKFIEITIPHSSKLIAPRKRLLKIKMQPPKSSRVKLGGWDTSRWIWETSQDFKQHLNTHKTLQVKHLAFDIASTFVYRIGLPQYTLSLLSRCMEELRSTFCCLSKTCSTPLNI